MLKEIDDDSVDESVDESSGWFLTVRRIDNGFHVIDQDGRETAFEEREDYPTDNDAQMIQRMLYFIINFFNLGGSKHDAERIYVDVQPGEGCGPSLD